jgi:hypothetical protein
MAGKSGVEKYSSDNEINVGMSLQGLVSLR